MILQILERTPPWVFVLFAFPARALRILAAAPEQELRPWPSS